MTTRWRRSDVSLAGPRCAMPRRSQRRPTYNLFRRRAEPDLICAVPNDFPVPAFLAGSAWTYAGSLAAASAGPPGFRAEIAEHGAETCGFHLFHQLPAGAAPAAPKRGVIARVS